MNSLKRNERILVIAVGFLLLSIILMIPVMRGVLRDTTPMQNLEWPQLPFVL